MARNIYTNRQKAAAIKLRKSGKSLREISLTLEIPKSTVRTWVQNVVLTKSDKRRLYTKKIEAMRQSPNASHSLRLSKIKEALELADTELRFSKDKTFLVAGAMLYWAEGEKDKNTGFTNSDPVMVELMVNWFRDVCEVPNSNLEARLHIHDVDQEAEAIRFWRRKTKIPQKNFKKSYVKVSGTGHRKNNLQNGIIRVRVSGVGNTDLRRKILSLSELYAKSKIRP